MIKCILINIKTGKEIILSDKPSTINDTDEFIFKVKINNHICKPLLMIGDIELALAKDLEAEENEITYTTQKGGFYENAHFLNYFGECEILVDLGESKKSFIVNINVSGYKANVAKEMLEFLSKNSDDILQSCYSKSRTGFIHQAGENRSTVKITALEQAVDVIDRLLPSFKYRKKYNIEHTLEYISNKPVIVDDTSTLWISENMADLEVSNSSQHKIRINRKHYRINIPNAVTHLNTDLKENRVLHQFTFIALKYLRETKKSIEQQITSESSHKEYSDYIKFDQVIKSVITPILKTQIKKIKELIARIHKLNSFFTSVLPVDIKLAAPPIQTPYTLRHRHYAIAFNEISKFYNASDAKREHYDFLLGLRNLSQLFELCCLYYLISYFKGISYQKHAIWSINNLGWSSSKSEKVNVLANDFLFENDHFTYSLVYEKKFFSLSKGTLNEQSDNLVRIDKTNNHFAPDFVIKVTKKSSNDYYFVILDAKFSRSYRMKTLNDNKPPSILQSVYNKYATNLKTYKNGNIVNLTRYVGVLFGLSKEESTEKRIYMFNKIHDIDGLAPVLPFSAADFISFSDQENKLNKILDKYIQH